ncbi:MAG: hypothetical protein HUU20_10455 [Pirellulales bacterium]|nr:hypothetical protein [Pirellulales bacterium]
MSTGGPTRKPPTDIYTLMLLLSLLAIIIGTVFLYLETKDYGSPPYQGGPSVSMQSSGASGTAMYLRATRGFCDTRDDVAV